MPRFGGVLLRKMPAELACCGGRITARTGPGYQGTVTYPVHDRWCRVRRILDGPSMQTVPGWEIQPQTDKHAPREHRR